MLVGRRGFTVRFDTSVAHWLAGDGDSNEKVELLRPSAALAHLRVGTDFYLLVGQQPVAKGRILRLHVS